MMKRGLSLLLIICTLVSPSTAHAGGWGVTTLDAWPQNVVVGKPVTVSFTIRQHGIHVITWVQPEFVFRNVSTQETFQVKATTRERLPRFIATMTFPSAGEWSWEMTSFPMQRFPNLTVFETQPTTQPPLDGKTLFVVKGCFMCHAHSAVSRSGEFSNAYGAGGAPTLSPNKWEAEYLRTWLKDPKAVKPKTQMPNLGLRNKEIEALVTFLTAKPNP
jgi:Cytochrome c